MAERDRLENLCDELIAEPLHSTTKLLHSTADMSLYWSAELRARHYIALKKRQKFLALFFAIFLRQNFWRHFEGFSQLS